ncbi:MAG TPA: hypothetical protein VGN14_12585 [Candidatus Elarobacter sp.]
MIGLRAALVAAAASLVPAPTALPSAAPTPPPHRQVTFDYKTFRAPMVGDESQIDTFTVEFGTMTLTFSPDASVRGTYRPDYARPATVKGKVDHGTLTLQVGGTTFSGRFTRRGFALATSPTQPFTGDRLWGQFVRAP